MTTIDKRLFHAIVLMGAGLTGGNLVTDGAVVAIAASVGGCGSSSANSAPDAGYGRIMAGPPSDSGPYGKISADGATPPPDSGYAMIMTAPPPDAGTRDTGADASDASEAGDAPTDALPDCYPCIAPMENG